MNGDALANRSQSRRELDFYPTPWEVTEALMRFLDECVPCFEDVTYAWEPACGDGAMAKVLEEWGFKLFATDIRFTGYGVGGLDYLEIPKPKMIDTIITNPPFKESESFIRKALEKDRPVLAAFLLKSQYWHAAKRTPLFNDHPPAWVLPLNWRPDFLGGERGGAPTMECLWTVWIEGETDTRYRILERPEGIWHLW